MSDSIDPPDDRTGRELQLLDDLRGVATRLDPPPPTVLAAASAAFELRDLEAQLAALIADSLADESLELVRGSTTTRLLTFEAPGLVIQLQVTGDGAGRRLVGELTDNGGAGSSYEVQVEHSTGLISVVPDEHGRFLLEAVPAGNLRLRVTGAGSRSVITAWVSV
jgi:hypothetical protein